MSVARHVFSTLDPATTMSSLVRATSTQVLVGRDGSRVPRPDAEVPLADLERTRWWFRGEGGEAWGVDACAHPRGGGDFADWVDEARCELALVADADRASRAVVARCLRDLDRARVLIVFDKVDPFTEAHRPRLDEYWRLERSAGGGGGIVLSCGWGLFQPGGPQLLRAI